MSLKLVVATPAGNLLGLILSPLLLQAYGWRSLFLIFGVLGGPLLLMWNLCVPSVQQPEPAREASPAYQRPAGGAYRPVPCALLLTVAGKFCSLSFVQRVVRAHPCNSRVPTDKFAQVMFLCGVSARSQCLPACSQHRRQAAAFLTCNMGHYYRQHRASSARAAQSRPPCTVCVCCATLTACKLSSVLHAQCYVGLMRLCCNFS